MQKTIKAKWSEITGNRKELDETIIGKGIEEQSLVNSDELNSIVNRQDEMLDDLQRGNAWNIGKEYNQGDMIFVNVNYKRLSDTSGKTYKCFVICKNNATTAEPFINNANKAIAFSKNYDYAVTQFIIQVDDDSTPLTHFINSDFWDFVTINDDLRNATKLNVSNEAKLGTQGKDSSIITFDRDIILNSNLDTKGTFDIKGNLTGGSLNSNNNIAWGNAFVKTPLYNAKGDEIVNAEWLNKTNKVSFADMWGVEARNFQIINVGDKNIQAPYQLGGKVGVNDMIQTNQKPKREKIKVYDETQWILHIYETFPQDFNIERFNAVKIYAMVQRVNEDLINDNQIVGSCVDSYYKYIAMFGLWDIAGKTIIYNYERYKIRMTIPQPIIVDFSESFEINTYEYFKKTNPFTIYDAKYYRTLELVHLDENNYDILSWNKDTRTLCLSSMQININMLAGIYYTSIELSRF